MTRPPLDPAFAAAGERVTLERGEILVDQDEDSTDVFVIVDGSVDVVHSSAAGDIVVGHAGPGEMLGEVSSLAGGRRTATLRSSDRTTVSRLDRGTFLSLLDSHPDVAQRIAATGRDRVDRTEVVAMVTELAGADDPTLVQEILDQVTWRHLGAGEQLFAGGDAADAAYFIVSGRLQVTTVEQGQPVVLGEFGRGEVIGELGLLDDAPRAATVRARRDSTLAVFFSRDVFEALVLRSPTIMLHVARAVLTRLRRRPRRTVARTPTIAIAVTAPVDPERIIGPVVDELGRFGTAERLSADRVDTILGRPGIADSGPDDPGVPRLTQLLYDTDVLADHIVLVADGSLPNWSRRALHQADRIVIVASARPDRDERRRIGALAAAGAETSATSMLALVHPASTARPSGTAALLADVGIDDVAHIRLDRPTDLARLARLASGNGVGLVLSGGGARGFAHIGVHRALDAHDVPIDFVAGCSMGAVMGAGMATLLSSAAIEEHAVALFDDLFDFTVPVVSVLKGARISERIETFCDGLQIEDLWLPYLCVSTNLTQSKLVVHRRGDLATALRASVAIPGILPPVPDGGDLLVDGGVLDNLPVAPVRADGRVDTIIAVDVALRLGPSAPSDYGHAVSGVKALAGRLGRRRSPYPTMSAVLMRSMLTGAVHNQRLALLGADVDLHLELAIPDVGLLAFDRAREVIRSGQSAVAEDVAAWSRSEPWRNRSNYEEIT